MGTTESKNSATPRPKKEEQDVERGVREEQRALLRTGPSILETYFYQWSLIAKAGDLEAGAAYARKAGKTDRKFLHTYKTLDSQIGRRRLCKTHAMRIALRNESPLPAAPVYQPHQEFLETYDNLIRHSSL